ncbi:MAG: tRNA-specific 2-thiouridylase MnmA [Thermonema sp.]|uniref:tRNA 2-thiouridine(34) synthase MnmA n=1 Tax=Thermonema sp. TaxID=2231181 RepID=UPI0021DC8DA6|nr:tRNA 2-thiouridine(34) synthase MnmA [Thermonema sp.]GIV38249.1 MAG: tRNA-specific 2-thiouridylase MnmA [Thermonema sp.]
MARIVVGMSGGVDSSVAAYLLAQEGHEVIGMFMRNWHDESVTLHDECPWVEDSNDALLVAEALGIPFHVIDLSAEYKKRIVDYMFAEYERGRTPNPDVLCNREIKFDVFLQAAMRLGADFVATGHYCQKDSIEKDGKTIYRLLAGADPNKDQSYFLCQLNQEQLSKALFPIGHLQKKEVRAIAEREGFVTAKKKDSQGLCFVGKIKLPEFLQQKLQPKKGKVIEIPAGAPAFATNGQATALDVLCAPYVFSEEMGEPVGEHIGAHYFTVGQRKGLGIGGKEKPLFVLSVDTEKNIVYVGQGDDHPGLHRKGLFVRADEVHWLREDLRMQPGESRSYMARIRYRQPLMPAQLHMREEGLYVTFEKPVRGITPGQFVAWYEGNELLGSGVIHA